MKLNPLEPRFWKFWCIALTVCCLALAIVFVFDGRWNDVLGQLSFAGINVALYFFWSKQ